MSVEQDKRLYAHYNAVIGGSSATSNAVRNELIVSDAKRHLADLVAKRGSFEEAVVEEAKEEPKSKGKK